MSEERLSVMCPRCGRRSWHPDDVAERYCAACHDWHPCALERGLRLGLLPPPWFVAVEAPACAVVL